MRCSGQEDEERRQRERERSRRLAGWTAGDRAKTEPKESVTNGAGKRNSWGGRESKAQEPSGEREPRGEREPSREREPSGEREPRGEREPSGGKQPLHPGQAGGHLPRGRVGYADSCENTPLFPPPRGAASSPPESRWNGKQRKKETLQPSSSPAPQIICYLL